MVQGQTWHFVVGERGDVVLQHLRIFGDDVCGGAVLLVSTQLVVGLDNVRQLVRQIVLAKQ